VEKDNFFKRHEAAVASGPPKAFTGRPLRTFEKRSMSANVQPSPTPAGGRGACRRSASAVTVERVSRRAATTRSGGASGDERVKRCLPSLTGAP
jgi:hypothetical protein